MNETIDVQLEWNVTNWDMCQLEKSFLADCAVFPTVRHTVTIIVLDLVCFYL